MAALTALTGVYATRVDPVITRLNDQTGTAHTVLAVLVAFTIVSFVCTLMALFTAVWPRANTNYFRNRYAWPAIARIPTAQLITHVATVDPVDEIWEQVRDLAALTHRKFRALRVALIGIPVFVTAGISSLVLTSAL